MLLGISFMCAALSNVTIMSLQIKLFHFITKRTVVQCQNFFGDSFSYYDLCEHMVYLKYNETLHVMQSR